MKLLAIFLVLGSVEGGAYWWMHPEPAGLGQPVLCYRPSDRGRETSNGPAQADDGPSAAEPFCARTPLPDVVAKSLPSLLCSTGTACRMDRDDGTTVHLAFFEWNLADSTSVLEAFKHLPDQCLGSIGMTLVEHRLPRSYKVGGETLAFDHTVFRDSGGALIHAFKATWVSGMKGLADDGFRGGVDQWRRLRWKAAVRRFYPAHARVAEGAVRGVPNADLAWQAFEDAMLKDLRFEPVAQR